MYDGQEIARQMLYYPPFSRTKVRYKLIGKPPVPKIGVGFKALCEFESRPHRHTDRSASLAYAASVLTRWRRKPSVGSNPTLSANLLLSIAHGHALRGIVI